MVWETLVMFIARVFWFSTQNPFYCFECYISMESFIHQLKLNFKRPLPGRTAQYKMAHAVRRNPIEAPDHARQAAVLALFYPKNDQWHIVLIERESNNPNDRHKGQIGFPGGRYEEEDEIMKNTALREAEEEVGVDASTVNIIGELSKLYIPVSNFLVHPFVGYTSLTPSFTPQIEEVKSILEVPFSMFTDPINRQRTNMKLAQNITLQDVPFFSINGKVVWGATAMMLSELLEVIETDC